MVTNTKPHNRSEVLVPNLLNKFQSHSSRVVLARVASFVGRLLIAPWFTGHPGCGVHRVLDEVSEAPPLRSVVLQRVVQQFKAIMFNCAVGVLATQVVCVKEP